MTASVKDYEARFSGISRLFGVEGSRRLRRARVCVVGIGGVGSWAVEAFARSGVGALTLVDLDDICVSNVNRQIHALDGAIGQPKAEAMARRVRAINPDCAVHTLHAFFTESNANEILQSRFDYVLDAIDSISKKCLLIAKCHEKHVPVLVVGGAGGRRNPTALHISDLAHSSHDRLLAQVRSTLRGEHGFPRGEKAFGIDCVYSRERLHYPRSDGTVCAERELGTALRLDCESGYGTASFVTGAFGFAAAGRIVEKIAGGGAV